MVHASTPKDYKPHIASGGMCTVPTFDAKTDASVEAVLSCQLCSERLGDVDTLENHLFIAHNVNKDAAKKLLAMLDVPSAKPRDKGMNWNL